MQYIILSILIVASIHDAQSSVAVYRWPAIGDCPSSTIGCVGTSGAKLVKDTENCWKYTCLHPCLTKRCQAGFVCNESPANCTFDSCEIEANCDPFVECKPSDCDSSLCPVSGFGKDLNNCTICKCADPCAELKCGDDGCEAVIGNDGGLVFSCIDY